MFGRLVKNAAQHTMNLEKASISNLNKALGSLEDSSLGGLGAERIFRGEGLEEGSAAFNLHTVLTLVHDMHSHDQFVDIHSKKNMSIAISLILKCTNDALEYEISRIESRQNVKQYKFEA